MTVRPRKTTEATLNPDEWDPITKWLNRHHALRAPWGIFMDPDALQGLALLLRKAGSTPVTEDIRIQLNTGRMESLRQQISFWSCGRDELRPEFQQDMPAWEHFHCMASGIEAALQQTHQENERRSQTAPRPRARPFHHRARPIPA